MQRFHRFILPKRIWTIRYAASRSVTSSGAIGQLIRSSVLKSFGARMGAEYTGDARVFFVKNSRFGDYQCNIALGLAKLIKEDSKKVAQTIVDNIERNTIIDMSKTYVSGPGFINICLLPEHINVKLGGMLKDHLRMGVALTDDPKRIVVDYSSPNIAKEMHVGHLRSTIIGDCLSNLLEFVGHSVIRVNHVGDWGTQFGMLVHFLKTMPTAASSLYDKNNSLGAKQLPIEFNSSSIASIASLYRQSKVAFDADDNFKEQSRAEVVALQSGSDKQSLDIWKAICDKSRTGFQDVYSFLNIRGLNERGESFYNPFLQPLVNALLQAGIAKRNDGAIVVQLMENGTNSNKGSTADAEAQSPTGFVIQKADGGYLYSTTDLAAVWHRTTSDKADMLLYVTDAGQSNHFQMVFDVAKQAGLLKSSFNAPDCVASDKHIKFNNIPINSTVTRNVTATARHVPFGLVLGVNGKKISSRSLDGSGDVRLLDLLQEAVRRSEAEFLRRHQERMTAEQLRNTGSSGQLSEAALELNQEQLSAAKIVAIAAVKYADLSMHRESNYMFSYEKMLALNGNTAPYLLYTFVRLNGILNSQNLTHCLDHQHEHLSLTEREEIDLAIHLQRFDEAILMSVEDLLPSKCFHFIRDTLLDCQSVPTIAAEPQLT